MEEEPEAAGGVLTALPIGVAVIEVPGRLRWANPAYFAAAGQSPSLVGRDLREIVDVDGTLGPAVREAIGRALQSGTPETVRTVRVKDPRGPGDAYVDIELRPIPTGPTGTGRVVLLVHEVTDRVRERRQAELFYAAFVTSSNAIEITDGQGILVDGNPAFERTYGYSRAECIGKKPSLVRGRSTPPELYRRMWAELTDPTRGYWSGELQNKDRWGKERPVFLTITAIRGDSGVATHYLGVAVDLSEQRSWERVAGHADRLASLGQLAAGVAHEINTPLANVMLVTESLRRKTNDPVVRARLDTITAQVDVAAKIVRGLLDFARRSEPQIVELDLRDVTHDTVEFLKGKQSENVEFDVRLPAEKVPIHGDRSQLIQVLTNILNNAYDAMEGEGRIRIEVRRDGDDAEVEIVDSGPGISDEALPHIFEPFYTTKPQGQGTGLGLAICHGIVQTHHGTMVARNLPEGGASFLITLPLAALSPAA
jgi:PAS domain S-box-containing protein